MPASEPTQTSTGLTVRISWMMLIPLTIFLCALGPLKHPPFSVSLWDFIQAALLALLIVMRRIDITMFHGRTVTDDEPATLDHWKRFALSSILAVACLQTLTHFAPILYKLI